jgi:hypothetical protein
MPHQICFLFLEKCYMNFQVLTPLGGNENHHSCETYRLIYPKSKGDLDYPRKNLL